MFFWLKKALGYWLMPVPVLLTLFAIGTLLLFSTRRNRLGRVVIVVATVLLLLLSNKFVSLWLVRPIEARYAAVAEFQAGAPLPPRVAACRFVVVLGSGNGDTPNLAAIDELSTSARARITEAVRLLRVLPEAKLIVSGPKEDWEPVSHATVLERAAVSLGADVGRIERVEHARDTEDESFAVKRRVGNAPFALVTSAWHMPRAMALFHAAGLNPLPCPTDFSSHWDGRIHWRDFLWDVESIERSSFALHERIGYAWIALRGKT